MPSASDTLTDIFPGDSELSRKMRTHDWAATSLGAPHQWPDGLKIPLRMMLTSRFEMWLGWGPELNFFYNDAYAPTLGTKHATALAQPVAELWREIYADIEDRVRSVIQDGVATWDKALMLLLERNGYAEETYHTFSYSPLRGDSGSIEGLMCVVTEETERVISERRLRTLGRLADGLVGANTREAVLARTAEALAGNRRDFPFTLLYLRHDDGHWTGHGAAPDVKPMLDRDWPLHAVERNGAAIRVPLDADGKAPFGDWSRPPAEALLVPIVRPGVDKPFGVLVFGLNPHRPDDQDCVAFGHLIAGQVAGALANVEAVESERRRADRIWINSRDLIVVITADAILQSVSPSWTQLLGHPIEEVLGRSFLTFIHADDVPSTRAALRDALEHKDLTAFENRYVAKAGAIRWFSWHTTVENGLCFAYGRDITESKAQADALKTAEEALRQSQKMEAVGQLTGGLAHDFNNLLTGITGSLELLQTRLSQGRTGESERYIAAAQGASRRAAALTHRLLAFSRRQTLDPKPTNVNTLVAGMEELIRRTVGPAIVLEVVQAGGLWPTLIDPNQLENALLNLAINARDAMPERGRVTIETANMWLDERGGRDRELPAGQYVSLSVSDTGSGMTPEVKSRAFDPFFTTKPIGQGTGLGLSMIYGFVRQSGGQVRIYSEVGHGTTMSLYLPRYHGVGFDAHDTIQAPVPGPRASQGETVLVVDDEPTVRMLVTEVLQDLGYTAIEAQDGAGGLRVLQSDVRIDLLVTDVGLPGGMNGRQMADAGRAVRPDLKVLFITGYAENAVVGNGHLEPGMHVLTKPFPMETLASRLKMLIAGPPASST